MKRIATLSVLLYLCGISIAQSVDSIHVAEVHSYMPQGVWMVTVISLTATVITIITGIVFIVWFVRDIRKENSKNLKMQTEILVKIEGGQREGYISMNKSLETQTKILEKIEAK